MTPRELWCAALRSGAYQRGVGFLHCTFDHTPRWCALGVACAVYSEVRQPLPLRWIRGNAGSRWLSYAEFAGETQRLPEAVREWLGLRTGFGEYADSTVAFPEYASIAFQGGHGMTFSAMAALIERAPEGLFA